MNTPIPLPKAGDFLLYGKKKGDLFGVVTSFFTYSPAVHIEVYIGYGMSVASRNGIGVNEYTYRTSELIAILRPRQELNIQRGLKWFFEGYDKANDTGVIGRPYGWLDLLRFASIKIKTQGWICSQFATKFANACGFYPFAAGYNAGTIDPGDYFIPNMFDWIYVRKDAYKAVNS